MWVVFNNLHATHGSARKSCYCNGWQDAAGGAEGQRLSRFAGQTLT